MDDAGAPSAANKQPIQQPTPQALPTRAGPSAILVSPRQKGNPILAGVRTTAWEYSDTPADYVLGATTCALFLSLKYHRLHPEYIYARIRDLRGAFTLRILLTMVDIDAHEEALRELSKTSLANNVTVVLCWSALEAGRYLELYKAFEGVAPSAIRAQKSSSYADNLVDFITVPRSINKTDAVGLVSNFGSLRTAVNASPMEVGLIPGWGEKKVLQWCNAVREPFRTKQAARRGVGADTLARDVARAEGEGSGGGPSGAPADEVPVWEPGEEEDEVVRQAERLAVQAKPAKEPVAESSRANPAAEPAKAKTKEKEKDGADMSEGVMAALSKLRQQ